MKNRMLLISWQHFNLDLVPGGKQPVKTSAPLSNCNLEGAARAPYAGGVVKIRRASYACA